MSPGDVGPSCTEACTARAWSPSDFSGAGFWRSDGGGGAEVIVRFGGGGADFAGAGGSAPLAFNAGADGTSERRSDGGGGGALVRVFPGTPDRMAGGIVPRDDGAGGGTDRRGFAGTSSLGRTSISSSPPSVSVAGLSPLKN